MKNLGNIIWHFPFLGFVNAMAIYLCGLILVATVVAAPIGLGLMEYAKFLMAPFSKDMVNGSDLNLQKNESWKKFELIVRILYFPIGLITWVVAAFQVAGLILSIVGIPMAMIIAKSMGTYLNPVGKKCVPRAVAVEIDRRKSEQTVSTHLS
jgi:uncharacterized membrane protein YccF (DUF307 family)